MLVKQGDPMPPLSAYPKEVQQTWIRILMKAAKRRMEREAGAAGQQRTAAGSP